jgi:hypothetical protein
MGVDEVRCVGELDASRRERGPCLADIVDTEIKDRIRRTTLAFRQEQPQTTATEEGEIAERIQVMEPQRVRVPRTRGGESFMVCDI